MKKQINLLLAGWMIWGCLACSEDALTPDTPIHNFEARPGEQDYEIRHDFFEKYNCYLIFNDTLRHDYIGTDEYGDPFYDTELLAPEWTFTGTEYSTSYFFSYFTTPEEKSSCVGFLTGVMDLLDKHNLTKPYSIFPVKEIRKEVIDDYGDVTTTFYEQLSTLRCFILNLSEITDTDTMRYFTATNIAGSGISLKYAEELAPFYALAVNDFGESLYGDYHWGDAVDIEDFNELGFLEVTAGEQYCSRAEDVAAYLNLLLTTTPQQVERKYRRYEIILKKYAVIREFADRNNIKYDL